MYAQTAVRKNIATMLSTIPEIEGRAFASRVHKLEREDIPCIVVKSGSQLIEVLTKASNQPRLQKRTIETEVYAFVRAHENIEDAMEKLASSIEEKVFEDPTLNGVAIETSLSSTTSFIGAEPNAPMGGILMTFLSTVNTKEGKPEVSIRN